MLLNISEKSCNLEMSHPPASSSSFPGGAHSTPTPGTTTQVPATYAPTTYPNPYQHPAQYPTTGITGYGQWPYPYRYVPQQHNPYAPRPAGPSTAPPPQRNATFSTYTPYTHSYKRDTLAPTATGSTTTRGIRRQQSNFKGVFAKER
jgi:hypothetical protein